MSEKFFPAVLALSDKRKQFVNNRNAGETDGSFLKRCYWVLMILVWCWQNALPNTQLHSFRQNIFQNAVLFLCAILEFTSLGAPLESFWHQGKEDSIFRKSGIRTQNLGIIDRHDLDCSNPPLPNSLCPKSTEFILYFYLWLVPWAPIISDPSKLMGLLCEFFPAEID